MDASPLQSVLKELHAALNAQEIALRGFSPALSEHTGALKTSFDSAMQAISNEFEKLLMNAVDTQSQIQAIEEAISRGAGDADQAKARVQELEAELEKQRANLEEIQERLADRERLLGDEKASFEAAHGRMQQLEKELQGVHATAEAHRQRAEQLEQELSSRSQEGEGRQREYEQLKASNESLRTDLEAARLRIEQLEKAWEEGAVSLAAAQAELEETKGRISEINGGRDQQQQAAAALQADLRNAQDENTRLKNELENAPKLEALETLRAQLEEERIRADLSEQRLRDEMAKGTKSVLAQQLMEALRDAEEAREELRKLKLELERSRLGTPVPGPSLSDEQRVLEAVKKRGNHPKISLGEILLEAGILTQDQLDQSLDEQRKNANRHLGEILVAHHFASDVAVAQALACQCGVEFIHFTENTVDPEAAALTSERLATQHVCIPIAAREDTIKLAIANPMDLLAIEDIERATNRKASVVVSTSREIKEAISRYYWEPE